MKFTILQWNVWYQESVERIVDVLRHQDADIMCLQELTKNGPKSSGVAMHEAIQEALGVNTHVAIAQSWSKWHKDYQANGIMTRFPIVDKSVSSICASHPPDQIDYASEGRIYLNAEIAIGTRNLRVGTTHLSYSHAFKESPQRSAENDRLVALLGRIQSPFVFAGDLNCGPESSLIKRLSGLFRNCGPELSECTWTTKPFSYNGFEESQLRWRLDYVFSTSDIRVTSAAVVPTDVSDHLPLRIECCIE